ncbi:hypothetical protein TNCV_4253931 [Trichonephila clavipes]|nr:hypothetical protein TNCV_4253931 [Trichonephila clavipes]
MCIVVLFSDFGINTNPKILCQKNCSGQDHELQHLQRRPFSSSFGTKEKNHYCAAARLQTTFKHQEEESPLLREGTAYAGQENMFLGRSNNGLLCCSRRVRFTMESDSGRLLIWREQRTRYHQSNTVERHSYTNWWESWFEARGSLGGHTLTCMCSMEEP